MNKNVLFWSSQKRSIFVRSIVLIALVLAPLPLRAQSKGNQRVTNFHQAKILLRLLYAEHPETLYSGCKFDTKGMIEANTCGFVPRASRLTPMRIEWEHIVPAQAFGRSFAAWNQGAAQCIHSSGKPFRGRRCAGKIDREYRRMEADLYNLVPEIDEINRRRANLPMGMVVASSHLEQLTPDGTRVFERTFEPRDQVKGDVARAYLYMDDAYPNRGILSSQKRALLQIWHRGDPVDAWECRRAWRIEAMQGNENRFIKDDCLRQGLWPQNP